MQIEQLQKHLETENVEFRGNCHDCGDSVNVLCAANEDGEIVVTGVRFTILKTIVPNNYSSNATNVSRTIRHLETGNHAKYILAL